MRCGWWIHPVHRVHKTPQDHEGDQEKVKNCQGEARWGNHWPLEAGQQGGLHKGGTGVFHGSSGKKKGKPSSHCQHEGQIRGLPTSAYLRSQISWSHQSVYSLWPHLG